MKAVSLAVALGLCVLVSVRALSAPVSTLGDDTPIDGRIVGGFAVRISQVPYQVSLQHYNTHICGASIIKENLILTAAHCLEDEDPTNYRIRAGSSWYFVGGQVIAVRQLIKHEDYSSITLTNDIALVVLAGALTLSERVQPVELATQTDVAKATELYLASGWGLMSETGKISGHLRAVEVPPVDAETCRRKYRNTLPITDEMLCAGYDAGGKDSCQGDSGGPLVQHLGGNRVVQVGVVSWGNGCAQPHYPGVYARVSALLAWIERNVAMLEGV